MDFLVVTGFLLIFVAVTWVYERMLSGGRPLRGFKRGLFIYASLFAAGMVYLMLAVFDLHWPPRGLLFPLIAAWGILVALLAWWRYRRATHS